MSDETVVETDGVTVSKFFNADDFPVPAVAFEVSSSLDEPVEFAIADEIPDEFGIDQIGFHPEYGSEHWTASGDGVVRFEREIEAGESFTTVYGVRMEGDQDETPFLSAPAVEVAADDIDDVVPPESTSVVRELAGGERDTVPGLEDDESIEADLDTGEDVEALEGDDAEILGSAEEKLGVTADAGSETNEPTGGADADAPAEPGLSEESPEGVDAFDGDAADDSDAATVDDTEPTIDTESLAAGLTDDADASGDSETVPGVDAGAESDAAAGASNDVGADTDAGAETGAGAGADAGADVGSFDASDIVGAVADAVREGRVSDDDLETLRGAFGGVPKSTQTEIEHLQSRVSEMESYADALKTFIDENGTAKDVLAEFEGDLASLQDDVSSIQSDVGAVESRVDDAAEDRADIREDLENLDALEELREDVARLSGDLEALDERVAGAEDLSMDVETLEDDVEAIEDDIESMEEWRDQLSDVFGA